MPYQKSTAIELESDTPFYLFVYQYVSINAKYEEIEVLSREMLNLVRGSSSDLLYSLDGEIWVEYDEHLDSLNKIDRLFALKYVKHRHLNELAAKLKLSPEKRVREIVRGLKLTSSSS